MATQDLTILHYTDNSLDEKIASRCRDLLLASAFDRPIISVSQKPVEWNSHRVDHIVSRLKERSHLAMYSQMLEGANRVDTPYLALAEHDCIYSPEHFAWRPPRLDVFYYNVHHFFLQWTGPRRGEFSYHRRRVLSMLICAKDLFLSAVNEKVWLLKNGWMIRRGKAGACEPGVIPSEEALVRITCEPGVCDNRPDYQDALAEFKDLGKEVGRWTAAAFRTQIPNIDIRHGSNFSGGRRGAGISTTLPYWGTIDDIDI